MRVINPVPWFPYSSSIPRYYRYDQIPAEEIIDGIRVYHPRFLVIPWIFKFIDAMSYRSVVLPLVESLQNEFNFDLVDLHWTYPDLPTGYAIKKKYKRKMIVTLRGKEAFYIKQGFIRENLIKRFLQKSDALIGLSDELLLLAKTAGYTGNHCAVIRNGVDTSRFHCLDAMQCRRNLGLSPGEKILLSVGSLNNGKGFDRIIKSFAKIYSEHRDWKLYIIGSEGPAGNCKKSLNQLIDRMDLAGNVILKGTVPNHKLPYWYNAADLFCLASRSEGTPNVLIEALSCGCPSVVTNVGSVQQVLTDQLQGIVVPNSFEGIRQGLRFAVDRQWDRKGISASMAHYDWDWCARQVLDLYQKLL
jgi:glycosyltransferase involved in cell wall biosynthesis